MDDFVRIPIGTGDHLIEAMIDAVSRDDVEVTLKISHSGMDISVTSRTEPRTRVTRRLIVKDFECANAMLASMRKDLEHCSGTKGGRVEHGKRIFNGRRGLARTGKVDVELPSA